MDIDSKFMKNQHNPNFEYADMYNGSVSTVKKEKSYVNGQQKMIKWVLKNQYYPSVHNLPNLHSTFICKIQIILQII